MKTIINMRVRLSKTTDSVNGKAFIFLHKRQVREYNISTRYFTYIKNSSITPDDKTEYILRGNLTVSSHLYNNKPYVSFFVHDGELSIPSDTDPEYHLLEITPDDDLGINSDTNTIYFYSSNAYHVLKNKSSTDTEAITSTLTRSQDKTVKLLIQSGWYEATKRSEIIFNGSISDIKAVDASPSLYETIMLDNLL